MFRKTGFLVVVVLVVLIAGPSALAQAESARQTPPRITQARSTQAIDETNRVTLRGNTRPEAGLAVSNRTTASLATATFDNVSIQ